MWIFGQRTLHINTLKHRLDVLPFTRLVVLSCGPVAHLLLIQHLKNSLGSHHLTQCGCIRLQFRFIVGKNKTPEHTCITFEGILALFCVPGLTVHIILVGKETVVSYEVSGITVIEQDIPHHPVKGYPDHILRTLVETGIVVSKHIEGSHPARVEIHRGFILELVAFERRYILKVYCIGIGWNTITHPTPQAQDSLLLVTISLFLILGRVGVSPHRILRIIELKGVIKLSIELRLDVFINLEQV